MKFFAIFGNPVSHSISPLLHNLALRGLDLDALYTRIHIPLSSDLKPYFDRYQLDAVNVTVPYKEIAYDICDEVHGIANEIKAVNTIVKKNSKLIGFNTDAYGFFESIRDTNINSVLILGAGGTAKAIAHILRSKNIEVAILNRSLARLGSFVNDGFETYSWDDFEVKAYDMIINTTSAGMSDNHFPLDKNILIKLFKKSKYAFDVIYNVQTPFIKLASEFLVTKNGQDMLLYQAVLAFNLFFNERYNENDIKKYMEKAFSL